MSDVLLLTDATFAAAVAAPVPVLVDFGATWCPPCRAMDPHVHALATEYAGRVRVGTCDVDQNPEAAIQYGVRSAPTFVMLRDGVEIERVVGAMSRARLEGMFKRALG